MKTNILLPLFIFCWFFCNSQVVDDKPWCPEGARWVYTRASQTGIVYNMYSYIEDEVVLGVNTKKIEYSTIKYDVNQNGVGDRHETLIGYMNLYNSNDSIFYYFDNQFKFLYNFNSMVNDELIIANYHSSSFCQNQDPKYYTNDTLIVSDVISKVFDNVVFTTIITNTTSYWSYSWIIKNIGGIGSFLANPSAISDSCGIDCAMDCLYNMGADYGLICYYDNLRGSILFNPQYSDDNLINCHSITTSLSEIDDNAQEIILFPNPSQENLSIILPQETNFEFQIIDQRGQIVYKNSCVNSNIFLIDVFNFDVGIYFLQVTLPTSTQTLKFIKN